MNKAKLTRAEKAERKYIKQQNAEFRKLQRQIVKKLKKAVMTKAIRFELLTDLDNCNNLELVHYLATQAQFTSDHEFVKAVNKFLELETITFEYAFELVYEVGNMDNVTKAITLQHNKIALDKEIFGE
jgi:hypothetical protein